MSAPPRHLALNTFDTRFTAVWIGRSELRVHLEVSQCRSQAAFLFPRHAAVVTGFGIFRIELDRLVEVRAAGFSIPFNEVTLNDARSGPTPKVRWKPVRQRHRSLPLCGGPLSNCPPVENSGHGGTIHPSRVTSGAL
jgi:hypothetical protein